MGRDPAERGIGIPAEIGSGERDVLRGGGGGEQEKDNGEYGFQEFLTFRKSGVRSYSASLPAHDVEKGSVCQLMSDLSPGVLGERQEHRQHLFQLLFTAHKVCEGFRHPPVREHPCQITNGMRFCVDKNFLLRR